MPTRLIIAFVLSLCAAFAAFTLWQTHRSHTAAMQLQPSAIDKGFVQAMGVHHQQAIMMAHMMLDGQPTRLESLAKRIAGVQLYEKGMMEGWLQLWSVPISPLNLTMDWMLLGQEPPSQALLNYLIDCQNSPQGMSGLASRQQLAQLQQLAGIERDQLFLNLMLAHHQGGLPMAQFAANNASLEVVQRLAKNIVLEQTKEIVRFKATLLAIEQHKTEQGPAAQPAAQGNTAILNQ